MTRRNDRRAASAKARRKYRIIDASSEYGEGQAAYLMASDAVNISRRVTAASISSTAYAQPERAARQSVRVEGKINLLNEKHMYDAPDQRALHCPPAANYSRAYIRHLSRRVKCSRCGSACCITLFLQRSDEEDQKRARYGRIRHFYLSTRYFCEREGLNAV